MNAFGELPELNSDKGLSARQIEAYRADGHTIVRAAATPDEIAAWRPVIAEAAGDCRRRASEGQDKLNPAQAGDDTYTRAFVQIENLWTRYEKVRRFVFARRFAKIAADLMGVDGVRVYHDQALFKEAGGGYTPWHQDHYYWPLDTPHTITMWMPLVDAGLEMGTLVFGSGTHKHGSLGDLAISDESEALFRERTRELGTELITSELSAGDATFHDGWTLHKAPGNSTNRVREVMTIIYYADAARVTEPTNEYHPREIRDWLGDRRPGQLADADSNPLVFARG